MYFLSDISGNLREHQSNPQVLGPLPNIHDGSVDEISSLNIKIYTKMCELAGLSCLELARCKFPPAKISPEERKRENCMQLSLHVVKFYISNSISITYFYTADWINHRVEQIQESLTTPRGLTVVPVVLVYL